MVTAEGGVRVRKSRLVGQKWYFLHLSFGSSKILSRAVCILHTWMLTSSLHCLRVSLCRTFALGTTYKRRGVMLEGNSVILFIPPHLSGLKAGDRD